MSLLGRLAVGWHPERAATIALAHILDVDASPDMASAFVGLLGETRPLQFTPVRVESNPDQKDDSLPDVTIYDDARRPRVFIETVFWEGVPQAQPLEYLAKLPGDAPSGLVYIAPRKRMRFLWEVLRKRCADSPGSRVEDETQRGQAVWARVGGHVLLVASWGARARRAPASRGRSRCRTGHRATSGPHEADGDGGVPAAGRGRGC